VRAVTDCTRRDSAVAGDAELVHATPESHERRDRRIHDRRPYPSAGEHVVSQADGRAIECERLHSARTVPLTRKEPYRVRTEVDGCDARLHTVSIRRLRMLPREWLPLRAQGVNGWRLVVA